MTLPADMPDDYQWTLGGQRALLEDQAELAARLGSPVLWDRRGQVAWMDHFASGLAPYTATGYGTGASIKVTSNETYLPGFSLAFIAGSDGLTAAELRKDFQPLESVRNGVECSFSCFQAFNRFGVSLNRFTGVLRYAARIRFYDADDSLYYTDLNGVDVKIVTLTDIISSAGIYQHLKVVADFALSEYVRVLFNTQEWDLRGTPLYLVADATVASYQVLFNHKGNGGDNPTAGLGHVILTTGEP